MKKTKIKPILKKLLSGALAAAMTLAAMPLTAFAAEKSDRVPAIGYARKSQYVMFGENSAQLNTTRATLNGNLYTGGNLEAYSNEVDVRGNTYLGGELRKHDYTIWNSYIYEDNSERRFLNDFTDEMTASLGDEYITHEYWKTYSDTGISNDCNIYGKSGLQLSLRRRHRYRYFRP